MQENPVADPLVSDIGRTVQFFVDDAMLAASDGLRRRFHPAQKSSLNPIVRQTEPFEGPHLSPVRVLRDEMSGGYRMWYGSLSVEPGGIAAGHPEFLHCAVSPDGKHWEKPALDLFPIEGDAGNNINVFGDGAPVPSGCAVFADPNDSDESRRYRLLYYLPNYHLAYSPDGRTWQPAQAEPVWLNGAGDGLEETYFFLEDELNGNYRGYMRVWQRHQTIRKIGLGESDDLLQWSGPKIFWEAGPEFGAGAQIYGMNVFIEGGVYWGLPWIYYTDEPLDPRQRQTMHLKLAWSHDGRTWSAVFPDEDVIALGEEGEFDQHMILTACPVVRVNDRLRLYYFGSDAKHDTGSCRGSIGLAEMRPGGFVSLRADDEGILLTRRFLFRGDRLRINARTEEGGFVAAELLSDRGGRIDRYDFEANDRFRGDAVDAPLSWRGNEDLSAFRGQNLMLRLRLHKADVFSFRVAGEEALFTAPLGPTPVRCGRCVTAPVIDGVLSDECWQDFSRTGIADDFVDFTEMVPAPVRTRVSMTYDDANLYIGVDCEEPATGSLVATRKDGEREYAVKQDDAIEIRLNAPGQGTFFNQLCVNASGNRFHAWFSVEEGGSEVLESIAWEAKTSVTTGHWYAEMAVPFAALRTKTPVAGDRWQMNVIRFRHAEGDEVSCWSCMFGNVHRNNRSGTMVFE